MKCPVIQASYNNQVYGSPVTPSSCIGPECEFFQESFRKCSVTVIADALSVIAKDLDRLARLTRADRLVFRCSGCGTTLSMIPEDIGTPECGWTRFEHTDGSKSWLCENCTEESNV